MRKFPTLASFRKPSPEMLQSSRLAASATLPDTTKAGASITLKRVAPVLKIDGTVYHVLDILIGLTQAQDWNGDNRPVVAISNERLADYTMRSERTVIRCLRKLVEAGILAYRDSVTGRRFVIRDEQGKQKAAFGLDFSPARARISELKAMAKSYQDKLNAERETRQTLSSLVHTINAYTEQLSKNEQTVLAQKLRSILDDNTVSAERRIMLVEALYEQFFLTNAHPVCSAEDTSPTGDTHVTPNYQTDNQHKDRSDQTASLPEKTDFKNNELKKVESRALPNGSASSKDISLSLVSKALRETKELLRSTFSDWKSLIEAAPSMCRMISISSSSWIRAVEKIGLAPSATVLGLVHEKACRGDAGVRSPQAYFLSLVEKMKSGEVHLQRSFYALAYPKESQL